MFQAIYRRTLAAAESDRALAVLFLASLAESAMLPIPIEAVSIPIMLAQPRRVWLIAGVAALGSVLGGMIGYTIGYFAFETLGRWLVEVYGLEAQVAAFRDSFAHRGWLIVAVGGITPLPYKIVSITCGLMQLSFPLFVLVSALSRGVRFLFFAALFWRFGPPIRQVIERHGALVSWGVLALLVAGFAAMWAI